MIEFKFLWENLENFSKEELCDIYWNLADGVWDRRIGRKPKGFDFLPDEPKKIKKHSKKSYLAPYIKKIEELTTQKERKYYLMVVIQKCITDKKFEEWWSEFSLSHKREYKGDDCNNYS